MNENIRKFAIETDAWCDQNLISGDIAYNEKWEEKFAALIIEECAPLIKDAAHDANDIMRVIKEHFGINDENQ